MTGTEGPIQAQVEPYFDAISGEFTENYLVIQFFLFVSTLDTIKSLRLNFLNSVSNSLRLLIIRENVFNKNSIMICMK